MALKILRNEPHIYIKQTTTKSETRYSLGIAIQTYFRHIYNHLLSVDAGNLVILATYPIHAQWKLNLVGAETKREPRVSIY